MTDERHEMLLDELRLEWAWDMAAEHEAQEADDLRAEAVALLGRRLRNRLAIFAGWNYGDLIHVENVLVWRANDRRGPLTDREAEVLEMILADTLPVCRPRIRKPSRTRAATLRNVPRRAYASRRQRLRKPEPCLPNRLAAHGPPRAFVAWSCATTAPVRPTTHSTGPP